MLDFLSNREIAIIIWAIIILIWISIEQFYKVKEIIILSMKLLNIFVILIGYGLIFAIVLRIWKWPDFTFTKDYIIWCMFCPVSILTKCLGVKRDINIYFKSIIREYFAGLAILELFINIYSLPLLFELILAPLIILSKFFSTAYRGKSKLLRSHPIYKFIILGIYTLLIFNTVNNICRYWNDLNINILLASFLFPIFLTVLFLPILYAITVYCQYQSIFILLDRGIADNSQTIKWHHKQVIKKCHISHRKLKLFRELLIESPVKVNMSLFLEIISRIE